MKDILIIANYISTKYEKGNSRFTYLADMLIEKENQYNIEIITSNFEHITKQHRNVEGNISLYNNYKLTMINEPGYKKNISVKRIYSHFILGKNLNKYLKNRKKPDVIYCAVPSLDLAYEAAKYAKRNNIKFIVDIQDLWPEAFKMVLNIPVISNLIFKPMESKANYIYKNADEIVAVSETYVNRGLEVNKKGAKGISAFLGTELDYFDKLKEKHRLKKSEDEIWLTYIGTLGHSYNLCLVIDALKIAKDKGIDNIKFMVIGDGPLRHKFEDYANSLGIKCSFTGRLEYGEMVGYLSNSDIAVNPIVKGAASIINKVGDYAAAGLPVLNTQECEEYRNLIKKYNCGINCKNDDAKDLSEKILYLYNNRNIRKEMGRNNRILAEEKFDRKKSYSKILEKILL